MARRYFSGYRLGMENEEVVEEAAAADDAAIAGAETLETELLEVAEGEAEQAAREDAIEEGEATVEELQEEVAAAEVAQESGGLDQVAAGILVRSVNSKLDRLGIAHIRVGAMESFGSLSSRQAATQVAMEAIGEKIKEIWKAILNAIRKSIDWVKNQFLKIFGAYESLQKRAKAIMNKTAEVTGSAKEKSFENERVFVALRTGNNSVDVATINRLGDYMSKIEDISKAEVSTGKDAVNLLKSVDTESFDEAAAVKLSESAKKSLDTINGLIDNFTSTSDKDKQIEGADSNTVSKPLPGNRVIVCNQSASRFAANRMRFMEDNTKVGKADGKKLNTLSVTDIEKVAKIVENIASNCIKVRPIVGDLGDLKGDLLKQGERIAGLNFDEDSEEGKTRAEGARKMQQLFSATTRFIGQFQTQALSYALTTGKAALDYCELSLKQYK